MKKQKTFVAYYNDSYDWGIVDSIDQVPDDVRYCSEVESTYSVAKKRLIKWFEMESDYFQDLAQRAKEYKKEWTKPRDE